MNINVVHAKTNNNRWQSNTNGYSFIYFVNFIAWILEDSGKKTPFLATRVKHVDTRSKKLLVNIIADNAVYDLCTGGAVKKHRCHIVTCSALLGF